MKEWRLNMKKTEETLKKAVVTDCDYLRLRSEPSVNSDIIALMPEGSIVTIFEQDKGWFFVEEDSTSEQGYCMKKYLTIREK